MAEELCQCSAWTQFCRQAVGYRFQCGYVDYINYPVDISVTGLTFSYPGTDVEVLKNISFELEAGGVSR